METFCVPQINKHLCNYHLTHNCKCIHYFCRADTLVRFAAGSPQNGLFAKNGPFLVRFCLKKSFFIHGICMYDIPLESSSQGLLV